MKESLNEGVYRLVGQVPRGRVISYGEIALALGRPHGARQVGWAMHNCPGHLPWQRVVNSQGELRTTERLPDGKLLQQALLEDEGVVFDSPGCLDLERYAWTGEQDG